MFKRACNAAAVAALAVAPTNANSPGPAGGPGAAEQQPRDVSEYNLGKKHLALEGYDPVAYFPEGGTNQKPKKGEARFERTHRGVVYRFSSQANLDLFLKDPERYEPAYGGWCAWAMADGGRKVEIDPKAFIVADDRLFVFYKDFFTDTRDDWKKDPAANARKADANWERLTGEKPRRNDE